MLYWSASRRKQLHVRRILSFTQKVLQLFNQEESVCVCKVAGEPASTNAATAAYKKLLLGGGRQDMNLASVRSSGQVHEVRFMSEIIFELDTLFAGPHTCRRAKEIFGPDCARLAVQCSHDNLVCNAALRFCSKGGRLT